jgi:hypothetical protein
MHHNPYVFGTPVCGEQFFGRKRELDLLWSRQVTALQPQCCSVVGETRIGKSSLKEQFLRRVQSEHQKDICVVKLSVNSDFQVGTTVDFYKQLFGRLVDETEVLGGVDRQALVRASGPDANWQQMFRNCQRFLRSVKSAGTRLLVVMDEFDYMDRHFEFDPQGWNVLRELADSPDANLIYLMLSRRPLSDIEIDLRISSNFANIFGEPIRLGGFSQEEARNLIIEPARRQGNEWPETVVPLLIDLTGGHPYLLQLVCFHLYEQLCQGEPLADLTRDILEARFTQPFYSFFNMLRGRLSRKDMFTTLLRVAYGAPVATEAQALEELVRLGYLDDLHDGAYRPFSPIFEKYLKSFRFTEELWPLIGRTEQAVRRMVESRYREKFADNWLDVIAAKNKITDKLTGKESTLVERWREEQNKEQRSTAVRDAASLSLLHYSYIGDLWQLINQQTVLFPDFLGKGGSPQRRRVEDAMNQLASVRNPSAHFRPVKAEAITNTHLACNYLSSVIPSEFLESTG